MSIVFQVIDTTCESLDNSFFVPNIALVPKSTTTIASILGYDEFIPSVPPKRYKKITWTGFSERTAVTSENTPRNCGGAKYIFNGVGEIDAHGNVISKYNKNFYAQCSKQFWPTEPQQQLPGAITTGGVAPTFVGYCWPDDPSSCPNCDSNSENWPFLGDYYTNSPPIDLSGFLHNPNTPVITHTSWSIDDTFYGVTSIARNPSYTAVTSGASWTMVVGSTTYTVKAAITDPPVSTFPVTAAADLAVDPNFYFGEYINFIDRNNYSAVLSEEYTDAEALANAQVIIGTSATAQSLPRTTGFSSRNTSVVYTLKCGNLIVGRDYVATVDLWDQPSNTHTPKTYTFTADAASHTIVDVIPTPAAGHTITVGKPTINFAP